jgi:predicted transport protein
MDKATQTMIDNLQKNTGKSLQQWIEIVHHQGFTKHGEMLSFLKEQHALTHGFANLIALKAKKSDAGSVENKEDLLNKQYRGKEHFKTLYEQLSGEIGRFGNDIEFAPKNAYVSVRRKKQFAMLQPATKSRFEICLNLKGQEPSGVLEAVTASNAMCTHKISLSAGDTVTPEVLQWLKAAYLQAG